MKFLGSLFVILFMYGTVAMKHVIAHTHIDKQTLSFNKFEGLAKQTETGEHDAQKNCCLYKFSNRINFESSLNNNRVNNTKRKLSGTSFPKLTHNGNSSVNEPFNSGADNKGFYSSGNQESQAYLIGMKPVLMPGMTYSVFFGFNKFNPNIITFKGDNYTAINSVKSPYNDFDYPQLNLNFPALSPGDSNSTDVNGAFENVKRTQYVSTEKDKNVTSRKMDAHNNHFYDIDRLDNRYEPRKDRHEYSKKMPNEIETCFKPGSDDRITMDKAECQADIDLICAGISFFVFPVDQKINCPPK